MAAKRKAWKIQEFVAHSNNVTCLAIGPKSGRVLVTGGEDRKVNMWALGQPNVIMSLSGHTTPVQCVQFNSSEEVVVAGSQSGSLKIWDLEAAKIVRTLIGHKSNVQCLDFHPYGDFVASGSLDTNVKLWDVRRKGCIFTYKGHTASVNSLKFSPDGRWVISGGEDSHVKLWDLTAGKILNEFEGHTSAVNCLEFHPKEFLMASGSSDRTVKFWDLETFELVAAPTPEQSSVRAISFHPDGSCLLAGAQDSLKTYCWEPPKCADSQPVGWGKVSHMEFSSDQLIGASFSQTNVSIWVVDLDFIEAALAKMTPDGNDPIQLGDPSPSNTPTTDDQTARVSRKSFSSRPKTSSTKQKKPSLNETHTLDAPTEFAIDNDGNNPEPYDNAFKPRQNLPRSPKLLKKKLEPFKAPVDVSESDLSSKHLQSDNRKESSERRPADRHSPSDSRPTVESSTKATTYQQPDASSLAELEKLRKDQIEQVLKQKQLEEQQQQLQKQLQQQQQKLIQQQQKQQHVEDTKRDAYALSLSTEKASIKPAMLTVHQMTMLVRQDHKVVCSILDARRKNLAVVGRLWKDGEIKAAIETAAVMPDQAVLVDLMNVLTLKQTLWNLDICVVLLPQLSQLLASKYDNYVETAANCLKLILKNFVPVIKSNMAAPPVSVGVDLVREERYEKCQRCYHTLLTIKSDMVTKSQSAGGRSSGVHRELLIALNGLE